VDSRLFDRKCLGNAVFRNAYRTKVLGNFLVASSICNFVFRTFVRFSFSKTFSFSFIMGANFQRGEKKFISLRDDFVEGLQARIVFQ
jgi:hypothetical protein